MWGSGEVLHLGREPRAPRASPCGPRGPCEALLEGRSRSDRLRGRPLGGGSPKAWRVCPGPLPAGGRLPWHGCRPTGGVPAGGRLPWHGCRPLEEYRLLERLLREQCVVGNKRDGRPGEGDDDAGEGAVPSPSGTRRRCGPIPCNRPTTRRPPTAGTKARGTRYRWRRPAMRRTPVDHSCRGDPIQRERHRRDCAAG